MRGPAFVTTLAAVADPSTTLRDGRYVLVRVLGEGGQATTYEAVDKREGRAVAIKRFVVRGAKSWKEVELAEREARVLASLDHPAIPEHFEHFEENGELYLVSEKIEGESLGALRKRGARLSEGEVVRLLTELDAALTYLGTRAPPVVHRDIKPNNVIRRPDGSFALIDFGSVAESLKPEGGSTVVGTFGYMAPEQFQGRALPATDVYAAGATALAMLTGIEPDKLPHRGLAIDVEAALAGSRVSPGLVKALSALLEPDPEKRAPRITTALRASRADKRSEPPPEPTPPMSRRERRRFEKQARRETREAYRAARRKAREANNQAVQAHLLGPFLWLLLIGLNIGQVALFLALRIFVPTLLGVLSVVFGKGLLEASRAVVEAGKRANASMARAKAFFRGEIEVVDAEGARIAEEQQKLRIHEERASEAEWEAEAAAEAEAEAAAEAEARGPSRRR